MDSSVFSSVTCICDDSKYSFGAAAFHFHGPSFLEVHAMVQLLAESCESVLYCIEGTYIVSVLWCSF